MNTLSRKEVKALQKLSELFEALSFAVVFEQVEIIKALQKAASPAELAPLTFPFRIAENYEPGSNIKELWRREILRDDALRALPENARELLWLFPERFSRCPGKEFGTLCADYASVFADIHKKVKEEREKKSRLESALILTAGVLAVIVLF